MTVMAVAPYSATRPRILVPLASGSLLPEERTAMMLWQRNCLRLQVPAIAPNVQRVRHIARRHVLDVFAAKPASPGMRIADFADVIELLVSELVTNAVRYKIGIDGLVTVELSSSTGALSGAGRPGLRPTPAAVKLSVDDDNPKPPPPAPSDPVDFDQENGRGLLLLYAHSDYADAIPTRAGGKRVRALVRVPPKALAQEQAMRSGTADERRRRTYVPACPREE
jgi:hypothetical protein